MAILILVEIGPNIIVKSQLYVLISNKIGDGFGKWYITYLDLYYIHSLVFVCDLAFMVDITQYLSELNVKLQGPN